MALLAAAICFGSTVASAQEAPPPPPPAPVSPPPGAIPPPPPAVIVEPVPPPPPVPAPPPPISPSDPLAGWSNGTPFLRSPDNLFILFPSGRLQVDGLFYNSDDKHPTQTFLLRRARLELNGWIGPWAYFSIAGDFATGQPATGQTNLITTDNYVAIAPYGDLAILQFGQYDAPFTLENRTSDKYFDFQERSITVRAFGIPSNKEIGWMLHGTNPERNYLYSLGVFNGDGQNFRNVDNNFDIMGRAWVAPLSFGGLDFAKAVTVGGSFWTGNRTNGLPLATQTTEAGFAFLTPSWNWMSGPMMTTPVQLRQQGRLYEAAAEINAPFDHKYGVRWEFVWKKQPLSAVNTTNNVILGGINQEGWSMYGQAWYWLMGDDRIIGEPGLQLPTRLKSFGVKAPERGLMVAARFEYLTEDITQEEDAAALMLNSPVVGTTKVTSFVLGFNYWLSKRFRATFNYGYNHFGGNTSFVNGLPSKNENEFLFRLAIAL
jgi:phosphate-selective porin